MGGGQSVSSTHFAQGMRLAAQAREKAKENSDEQKTIKM